MCIVSFIIVILILLEIVKILKNFFKTNMIKLVLLLQLILFFFLWRDCALAHPFPIMFLHTM